MIGGCYLQNTGYEPTGYSAVTPTSSSRTTVRRRGGTRVGFRLGCDLLPGPAELGPVGPDPMHDDGELAGDRDDRAT